MYDKNKTSKDSELYGWVDDTKSGIGKYKYGELDEKIRELDRKYNEKEISNIEYCEGLDKLFEDYPELQSEKEEEVLHDDGSYGLAENMNKQEKEDDLIIEYDMKKDHMELFGDTIQEILQRCKEINEYFNKKNQEEK